MKRKAWNISWERSIGRLQYLGLVSTEIRGNKNEEHEKYREDRGCSSRIFRHSWRLIDTFQYPRICLDSSNETFKGNCTSSALQ